VICNNMAQGVREVTIKRGFDPREFPMIVAGGAGPIHSCLICEELDMPFQIVPRESSILCAYGMLMSDLKHDFVRTFVARLDAIDWPRLNQLIGDMVHEGRKLLSEERIAPERQRVHIKFDCRYLKQYHEVSFEVPAEAVKTGDTAAIATLFHAEHNRLYGYSLEAQKAPVEIINVRVQAVGHTDKPAQASEPWQGSDPKAALKGERSIYIPERKAFKTIPVYDGHRLRHGNLVEGPAMIEEVTTAIFVSEANSCVCDATGSFAIFRKGRQDLVASTLKGA
jgi:N-methylhydantoinase A